MTSLFSDEYRFAIGLLIEARQAAGMTQQQLAAKVGRPQSFVSKYGRGERRLDVVEFIHVALSVGANPVDTARRVIDLIVAVRSD